MALFLLNISVDTADLYPEHISEDLSFNDQESFVEILLEKVLGYEDAIKEYDDIDTKDHHPKKRIKKDVVVVASSKDTNTPFQFIVRKYPFPNNVALWSSAFLEIDSPPPKA